MKAFTLLKDLSYAFDGVHVRVYAKGQPIAVHDDQVAGLAQAGYFDAENEIKDMPAPEVGGTFKPPYFDQQNHLVSGDADHEARSINDMANRPSSDDLTVPFVRQVQQPIIAADAADASEHDDPRDAVDIPEGWKSGDAASEHDDPRDAVDIPEGWKSGDAASVRAIADLLDPENPVANRAEAEDRIEAELLRREEAANQQ